MGANPKKRTTVLVVDDEEGIRLGLKLGLERRGYHVEEAATGKHAIQKLKANPVSLVLCDLKMPGGINGQNVLEFVRKSAKLKSVPFMMITAHADKDKVLAARKGGVTEYVVKPFKPEELYKKIEALVPIAEPEES
jgi:CheY-like chemotaxis protein